MAEAREPPVGVIQPEAVFTGEPPRGLLNMGNTCYLNSAVQALAHCEDLEKIEIRKTQVSDTGARELADWCVKLKHVDLNGTKVTVDPMRYMKLKRPRLAIYVSRRE